MTSCVAAISADRKIVTASDTKMSFSGMYSVEQVIKLEEFHKEWSALIGGNDIAQAPFVISRAKQILKGKPGTLEVVKAGFKRAYQEQLREDITDEFLSPFNMTLEDFKKKGRKQLEPNLFQSLSFGIKNAKLGCKFLVYGFDPQKVPHLFEVGEQGRTESRDKPGFWAIGSGAPSAISMLAHLGQGVENNTTLNATIYNVLAAKYISESASDVGEATFLYIKKYGCDCFFGSAAMEKNLKRIWKEKGRPTIPPEALQIIEQANIRFPDEPISLGC